MHTQLVLLLAYHFFAQVNSVVFACKSAGGSLQFSQEYDRCRSGIQQLTTIVIKLRCAVAPLGSM